jgi:tRNA modification GTPase
VRVSGPRALLVADQVTGGRHGARRQPGHTLRRVQIRDPDSGDTIDEALLAVFRAPRSFTGEDVAELHAHGGAITLGRVLAATLRAGARAARPGEFTERAFVNGKLDLAQAEAVADLVSAQTVAAQRVARRQADGSLSKAVHQASAAIRDALALVEASIDFPEEVGEIDPARVDASLQSAAEHVDRLLATATYGRRLREGLTVVLAGRPNVGKSSLLNALSGTDRAIVTATPGTTRDIVEEALHLHGMPVRLLDTAGIRDTPDPVEQIGVNRARDAADAADVVILVMDATASTRNGVLIAADRALLAELRPGVVLIAVNKTDVADPDPVLAALSEAAPAFRAVATSAVTGEGLSALTEAVARLAGLGASADASMLAQESAAPLVTSARHEAALAEARTALLSARTTLAAGFPAELIAVDAHGALHALGAITGETVREEIIHSIFARFCLGK